MAEGLRGEIERLLAEGGEPHEAKEAGWRRARLAADLSQALGGAGAGEPHGLSDDLAAKAAFLDDGQIGPDRKEFAAALANDEKLRADVESALALIEAVGSAPAPVPKQLLRQAQAQFSPAPGPRPAGNRPRLLSVLWPRSGAAWAAAAVLAVVVIVPGALLVMGDRLQWSPWHAGDQPSASVQPDIEPPKACEDAPTRTAAKAPPSEKKAAAPEHTDSRLLESAADAPCPPPASGEDRDADPDLPAPPVSPPALGAPAGP